MEESRVQGTGGAVGRRRTPSLRLMRSCDIPPIGIVIFSLLLTTKLFFGFFLPSEIETRNVEVYPNGSKCEVEVAAPRQRLIILADCQTGGASVGAGGALL